MNNLTRQRLHMEMEGNCVNVLGCCQTHSYIFAFRARCLAKCSFKQEDGFHSVTSSLHLSRVIRWFHWEFVRRLSYRDHVSWRIFKPPNPFFVSLFLSLLPLQPMPLHIFALPPPAWWWQWQLLKLAAVYCIPINLFLSHSHYVVVVFPDWRKIISNTH